MISIYREWVERLRCSHAIVWKCTFELYGRKVAHNGDNRYIVMSDITLFLSYIIRVEPREEIVSV